MCAKTLIKSYLDTRFRRLAFLSRVPQEVLLKIDLLRESKELFSTHKLLLLWSGNTDLPGFLLLVILSYVFPVADFIRPVGLDLEHKKFAIWVCTQSTSKQASAKQSHWTCTQSHPVGTAGSFEQWLQQFARTGPSIEFIVILTQNRPTQQGASPNAVKAFELTRVCSCLTGRSPLMSCLPRLL